MTVVPHKFAALVVQQWLADWETVAFDEATHQSRPQPHFLLTSMPASMLRRLSNTYRRDPGKGSRAQDTGIQRKHDEDRSQEISRYVREGYPLSTLSEAKRRSADVSLQKPGWLPTAIVVNILDPANAKAGRQVAQTDALQLPPASEWQRGGVIELGLPESWTDPDWEPNSAHPIEIIDGQHRLWSFEGEDTDADFDLPVVAFFGLDVSWQAYLFWTINIKPKKINASLAYDLYPLLRDQEWLIAGEGIDVYRETRSQELTEALWSHPKSPWRDRINMLGETGVRSAQPVTQAAFVRSIAETFVRPWKSRSSAIGGLFGGAASGLGLDWSRAQQAAFLIGAWESLREQIAHHRSSWTDSVRETARTITSVDAARVDPAFAGPHTLLSSDQGVRAFHQALNDLVYLGARKLEAEKWRPSVPSEDVSDAAVSAELASWQNTRLSDFVALVSISLASFDWRNAKAEGLSSETLVSKQALRGTGGYKILRERLLHHLADHADGDASAFAKQALDARS